MSSVYSWVTQDLRMKRPTCRFSSSRCGSRGSEWSRGPAGSARHLAISRRAKVLLNVRGDDHFQAYLDEAEQRLYAQMQPLLRAAINLHLSTNSVRAWDYVVRRGEPMLRRHYI